MGHSRCGVSRLLLQRLVRAPIANNAEHERQSCLQYRSPACRGQIADGGQAFRTSLRLCRVQK